MTHCLADGGDVHMLVFGDAGPRMTRHIRGHRELESEGSAHLLEFPIHPMQTVRIVQTSFRLIVGRLENRKQIVRMGSAVFIDQFLHTGHPADLQRISGLLAGIDQVAMLQVRFLQMCDVDERHPPRIDAEEEEVAGKLLGRLGWQWLLLQLLHLRSRQCPFRRFVNAGIDALERMSLFAKPLIDRLIVEGPQVAHVEGGRVAAKRLLQHPGLILLQQRPVQPFEREGAVAEETLQTVQRGLVFGGQRALAGRSFLLDGAHDEGEEIVRLFVLPEPLGNVCCRIIPLTLIEADDDQFEPFQIDLQSLADAFQIVEPFGRMIGGKDDRLLPHIPLLRKQLIGRSDLAGRAIVKHLEIDFPSSVGYGRLT